MLKSDAVPRTHTDWISRYKRKELGIRAAVFFSAAALAGSFGGLLAAGIAQMKGVGGKPGWVRLIDIVLLDCTNIQTGLDLHLRRPRHRRCWCPLVLDGP